MRKDIYTLCAAVLIILTSCATTKITSSWRKPNKEVELALLHKVLVVAVFKTVTSSRMAEDEMVSYLNGKGVASYQYLGANFNKNSDAKIRERTRKDGFDGAITMRLIDVDKEQVYQPKNFSSYPLYYHNFDEYFYRSYPYLPANYETTKTYTVETNVYSLKEDNIIWTGLTKTTNPDGVGKMTKEIAKVVYRKMIKEEFIAKK